MAPGDDYINDIFLSYTNRDPVGAWVHNHFYKLLGMWLENYWGRTPKIAVDRDMETGVHWPSALRENLLRSRCMVAIWSPPYFLQSRWCMAEWQSMRERERLLGLGQGLRPGLIFPVIFADGDLFPAEARQTQARDLSRFNKPQIQYSETREYLDFDTEMQQLARSLIPLITGAPAWQAGWPVIEPDLEPTTPMALPRLK